MKSTKMSQKKLFEILNLIGNIYSYSYAIVKEVFAEIEKDTIVEIQKKWHDRNYTYSELNLKKWDNWSTYDKCYNLVFSINKNKLYCHITIYNGDMGDGLPTTKRFTATIELPNNFILKLSDNINSSLDYYISEKYEEHLENERKLWMLNMKNEILKK